MLQRDGLNLALFRRLDALATPPGTPLYFHQRIGVFRTISVVDERLIDRCIDRWDEAEAKEVRILDFLDAIGFSESATTVKTPQPGAPPSLEMDLTEG